MVTIEVCLVWESSLCIVELRMVHLNSEMPNLLPNNTDTASKMISVCIYLDVNVRPIIYVCACMFNIYTQACYTPNHDQSNSIQTWSTTEKTSKPQDEYIASLATNLRRLNQSVSPRPLHDQSSNLSRYTKTPSSLTRNTTQTTKYAPF